LKAERGIRWADNGKVWGKGGAQGKGRNKRGRKGAPLVLAYTALYEILGKTLCQ